MRRAQGDAEIGNRVRRLLVVIDMDNQRRRIVA
jgi:hypothetical protein